jgi:hypothetical protein
MYQANLPHILAKTSPLPSTLQDYNAALANAGNFLAAIEKAHELDTPFHVSAFLRRCMASRQASQAVR